MTTKNKLTLTPTELNTLKKAKKFSQDIFRKHSKNQQAKFGGHGLDHALRVTGLAAYLSIHEKEAPFLPILAALLHDIGRANTDPRSLNALHGLLSREMCQDFLSTLDLKESDRLMLENAIEDHPFLNDKVRQSYVVEILMDADRLDGLGPIGPIRAAAMNWRLPLIEDEVSTKNEEINSIYGHFGKRMLEWVDMMWTESGKRLAQKRAQFHKKFNTELLKDLKLSEDNLNLIDLD